MKKLQKPELSIVILNYNTKNLLVNCLESLKKVKDEVDFEIIVVDNGSTDDSVVTIKKNYSSEVELIESKRNLGFAAGNNLAKSQCHDDYVLFLNSDTEIYPKTLQKTVAYLRQRKNVGALTCRLEMKNGKLDPDSRRAFPTPWKSFTHFSGLGKIFPHSKLFSQYRLGHISENKLQEVEVIQAAFFLTRRKILDKVGWFDEDYFLNGEDIELCWQIKKAGYKIIYYPKVSILHIKKGSKGKTKRSKQTVVSGIEAMEIFYGKHLKQQYSPLVNLLVFTGMKVIKIIRLIKFAL